MPNLKYQEKFEMLSVNCSKPTFSLIELDMRLLPAGLTPTHEKLPEKTRLTDSRTSLLRTESWRDYKEDNRMSIENLR